MLRELWLREIWQALLLCVRIAFREPSVGSHLEALGVVVGRHV